MRRVKILLVVSLLALVAVPSALALRFTDESFNPPVGETGKPYPNWSFTGAGGCGPALPYQYRVLPGSTMPPGLNLASSGLVYGTPTQAGSFTTWVELSDEDPPSQSWCRTPVGKAQREFTFKIIPGLTILQRQGALGVAGLNQPFSLQLTATGPGTWKVTSGALPAGISLNSSTGLLSGTPTATGDYTFKIQVSDGTRSDSQTYTLSVYPALKITKFSSPQAEVSRPFTLAPKATGGKPAYTWSLSADHPLPAGLTLDAATGAITGTPTVAGSFPLQLFVKDSVGLVDKLDLTLVVSPKLVVVKRALPGLKVGSAYSARLLAQGGVAPLRWKILGGLPGFLPTGIKLNAKTGLLTGTPTKSGVWRLRFQVRDKVGAVASIAVLLRVKA